MGTTAEKLQYLNETKGMIKTAIKDKGVEIADTDTFRSYVDKIGEIPTTVVEEVVKSEKYGMTMDSFFGDVDENGVLQAPVSGNLVGTGIKVIGEKALYYKFYQSAGIGKVSFPDLEEVDGSYVFSYAFHTCPNLTEVSMPKLKSIKGYNAFYYAFNSCSSLTKVDLSGLTAVNDYYACGNMFRKCTNLTEVNLSSLSDITGSYPCDSMFYGCTSLASIDLPALVKLGGDVRNMFNGCSLLNTTGLSNLQEIDINGTCYYMYGECKGLTSVNFSKLSSVSGSIDNMFYNCTNLQSVSFPALTYTRGNYTFSNNVFSGCTSLTEIHFRADMQSKVELYSGYADKFGAVNATIYFDL